MEIVVGKTAGFCYGVENAVKKTEKVLEEKTQETNYCLGELVHNRQVVEKLQKQGLKVIEEVNQIDDKIESKNVIIRAHGVPPKIYQEIEMKKGNIIDLTCPNVLMIHKLAEEYVNQGYYIFLTGKKEHPEVVGIIGYCQNQCSIIESEKEIEEEMNKLKKSSKEKVVILSQTTFSMEKFQKIVETIQDKFKNTKWKLEIKNTICNATKLRQEETEELSKKVDCMIIIGGKNSSNTKKLYEIASQNCKNAVNIETKGELAKIQLNQYQKIGIMAGASTPAKSMEEVITYLNEK